jgi:hypothetical protein
MGIGTLVSTSDNKVLDSDRETSPSNCGQSFSSEASCTTGNKGDREEILRHLVEAESTLHGQSLLR